MTGKAVTDAGSAGVPRAAPALAALALGGFAIGTTEFATMGVLPLVARDLSVDIPHAGEAISAYALGVVLGAPTLAVAGARVRRRTMLITLALAIAAGNALSAVAPNLGTLLAFRFLSGLPHGAYFGLAALATAGLVDECRRTAAIGTVMSGLTVATVLGSPTAQQVASIAGWRVPFMFVAVLAVLTAVAIAATVPDDRSRADAGVMAELAVLRVPQVWLTLGIGAIGFGGLFAVYTYLVPTLGAVTHAPGYAVPLVLALFGVGMTAGNLVVPRFADRALMPTVAAVLLGAVAACALYPVAARHLWSMAAVVVAIGMTGALGTLLQARLMDVAGEAQTLAAALNHSAFNAANALGPWLGGLAIAAGWGWTSTGPVGAALALGGLVLWAAALIHDRGTPVPRTHPDASI